MDEKAIQQFPVLRSAYGGLTKSERRIADYIVAAPEEIMEQTISDIANATESSESTVSRFCKKQDTLALLDYDAVDDAARILRRARRVAVFGFGNSATVCRDIATRYLRLGLAIQAYADSHMQVTSAALLSPADAVIAVSHSGASQELLQSVQVAKDSGASVVVITSHAKSPLAKLADVCLCGMGREVRYSSEAGASRLIHMAIGDVLYTRIAMADAELFQDNMQKMRREITKKRI